MEKYIKLIQFNILYPSGARSNTNVFIEIDMGLAMTDGIVFYLSSNGVILSDGVNGVIEPKYFKNIIYK
jgi:2'-phosphotransferase